MNQVGISVNRRFVAGVAALVLTATWLMVGPARVAKADAAQVADVVNSFAECAANGGSAEVILLIDQSSSLRGEDGSDPEKLRQKAARDFVNQLAAYSAQSKIPVSVMASGFDGDYRPGTWLPLTPEGLPAALESVDATASQDSGEETDYWNALEGARKDLAAGASTCDLVVWFTDGEYLVEGIAYGEVKPYSDKNALTDSAGVINDGKASICSPLQGPMNSMRAGGVFVIGVGLSAPDKNGVAPDLTFVQQASLGINACGAPPQPGHAAFIEAKNAGELIFALGSLTATSVPAPVPFNAGAASVDFGLDPYITSASVLADAGAAVPGIQFGLQGPGVPDDKIAWAPPAGGKLAGPGADVEAVAISDRAMRFNIVKQPSGTGYAGTWKVRFKAANPADVPADTFARASISVVGDLRPAWTNAVPEAETGAELPMTIAVVKADGVPVAEALPNALVSVEWVDSAGQATLLAEAPAADFAKGRPVALATPEGEPLAPAQGQLAAKLNLTTTAQPPTTLRPEVVPYPLTLKAPVNYPSVETAPLVLQPEQGEFAEGVDPSVGQIRVTGPGCVWLDAEGSAGKVTSLPDGVDAISVDGPATSGEECLRLNDGQSETLAVQVIPASQGNGVVTGKLTVLGAPLEGNAEPVVVPVEFTAERTKEAGGVKWLALVVGMLLGLGIPAALLMWVRARMAKIPVSGESTDLVSTRKVVRVVDGRVVDAESSGPVAVRRGDAIETHGFGSQGEVPQLSVDDLTLRARALGNPFSVADVDVSSAGGPVVTDTSAGLTKDGHARLPLVLQGHWVARAEDAETVTVVGFFNQHETSSPELMTQISESWDESLNSHITQLEELLAQQADDRSPVAVGAATVDSEWADGTFATGLDSGEWRDDTFAADGFESGDEFRSDGDFGNGDDFGGADGFGGSIAADNDRKPSAADRGRDAGKAPREDETNDDW